MIIGLVEPGMLFALYDSSFLGFYCKAKWSMILWLSCIWMRRLRSVKLQLILRIIVSSCTASYGYWSQFSHRFLLSGYPSSYGYRRTQPRDNPVPSRCIGVFGLSLSTTERNLYDLFSRYGEVEDVTLVYDNFTGHSRGFGFVYMRHLSDAKEAKHDAHGTELDGRPIRVDYSVTERPHSPTPGVYMGRPTR